MNKMIAVGVLLAATLAMAAEANVPDVLTAIATRKSIRKFDPLRTASDSARSGRVSIRAKTVLQSCARFWRFPMATRRSTSFRSAIRRKIRR